MTRSNPGAFSEFVDKDTTTETAFQRAIWQCKTSRLGNRIINWIDIELPVDDIHGKSSKRMDLIGKDEDTGRFVICELKFQCKGNGNSPSEAYEQIIRYKNGIHKNKEIMGCHTNSREVINWDAVDSESTILVIAANESYWEYWRGRNAITDFADVECYALPVDPDAFEKQSEALTGTSYKPELTEEQNIWRRV